MKKFLFIILVTLSSNLCFGQYYNERTTEHNFEKSEMFFTSHYLNPYGMKEIKQLAVSLIDDPFLNIHLNPAILPNIENGTTKVYLDFRGDRTEAPIVNSYIMPTYYDASYIRTPYPDYRLISSSREEPEPIVSIGLLTYPIESLNDKFYIGGTFQYIHSKDKFYSTPFNIYTNNYYSDSFGARAEMSSQVPVIDRYAGKDEMILTGELFSFYTGAKLFENFNLGINFNSINYKRTGSYLNENNDDYGNLDNNENSNKDLKTRDQSYSHYDIALGLLYEIENYSVGIKAGYLDGNVDQLHNSESMYLYKYQTPEVSEAWNHHYSNFSNQQNWDQTGTTKYLGINFSKAVNKSKIKGYYKYSASKVNSSTTSTIYDTSFSSSRWVNNYNSDVYIHNGRSYTKDNRVGDGIRESFTHEAMLNFDWALTENITLLAGLYLNKTTSTVYSSENAKSVQLSYYKSEGNYNYENNYSTKADKNLTWNYNNKYFTFQIPIILNFKIADSFDLMLGVTRAFQDWNISSSTDVFFRNREVNDNGVIKTAQSFIERYTSPSEVYTEDFTNLFTKFNVSISEQLKVGLLIDPEFEDTFRIAQWWLSFNASL